MLPKRGIFLFLSLLPYIAIAQDHGGKAGHVNVNDSAGELILLLLRSEKTGLIKELEYSAKSADKKMSQTAATYLNDNPNMRTLYQAARSAFLNRDIQTSIAAFEKANPKWSIQLEVSKITNGNDRPQVEITLRFRQGNRAALARPLRVPNDFRLDEADARGNIQLLLERLREDPSFLQEREQDYERERKR